VGDSRRAAIEKKYNLDIPATSNLLFSLHLNLQTLRSEPIARLPVALFWRVGHGLPCANTFSPMALPGALLKSFSEKKGFIAKIG
jgi:hypothetical protein